MTNNRSMYMRMAAAAGSLALAVSAISAPAVVAQDNGPQATVTGVVEAIEAKDFEALPSFFCEEFAGSMGGLDFASISEGMPPGMDAQMLLDAFIIDVTVDSLDTVSESDTEAVVNLVGSMTMNVNIEALGPFIEVLLASMGEEVTPEMIDMFTGIVMSEFEVEETDISSEVTLVPGDSMAWLICSDLTGGDDMADDEMDAEAVSADAMAEDDMEEEDGE